MTRSSALAEMPTAAPDFTLMWDNAYAVHHLTDDELPVIDVLALAPRPGIRTAPIVFASTSKITFAGGGVGFVGGSPANDRRGFARYSFARNIGPDKINQLRHVRFLKDADGVRSTCGSTARCWCPSSMPRSRFSARAWRDRRSGRGRRAATSSASRRARGARRAPSLLPRRRASRVTAAGAPYPYGDDPRDSTIRIAPSFPSIEDLRAAIDGLCTCILLAQAERAAASRGREPTQFCVPGRVRFRSAVNRRASTALHGHAIHGSAEFGAVLLLIPERVDELLETRIGRAGDAQLVAPRADHDRTRERVAGPGDRSM